MLAHVGWGTERNIGLEKCVELLYKVTYMKLNPHRWNWEVDRQTGGCLISSEKNKTLPLDL
jgi:hypothetical protein